EVPLDLAAFARYRAFTEQPALRPRPDTMMAGRELRATCSPVCPYGDELFAQGRVVTLAPGNRVPAVLGSGIEHGLRRRERRGGRGGGGGGGAGRAAGGGGGTGGLRRGPPPVGARRRCYSRLRRRRPAGRRGPARRWGCRPSQRPRPRWQTGPPRSAPAPPGPA